LDGWGELDAIPDIKTADQNETVNATVPTNESDSEEDSNNYHENEHVCADNDVLPEDVGECDLYKQFDLTKTEDIKWMKKLQDLENGHLE